MKPLELAITPGAPPKPSFRASTTTMAGPERVDLVVGHAGSQFAEQLEAELP